MCSRLMHCNGAENSTPEQSDGPVQHTFMFNETPHISAVESISTEFELNAIWQIERVEAQKVTFNSV